MKAYGWQLQDTQIYHQMFGVWGGGGGVIASDWLDYAQLMSNKMLSGAT
jgi:hypothetical protein